MATEDEKKAEQERLEQERLEQRRNTFFILWFFSIILSLAGFAFHYLKQEWLATLYGGISLVCAFIIIKWGKLRYYPITLLVVLQLLTLVPGAIFHPLIYAFGAAIMLMIYPLAPKEIKQGTNAIVLFFEEVVGFLKPGINLLMPFETVKEVSTKMMTLNVNNTEAMATLTKVPDGSTGSLEENGLVKVIFHEISIDWRWALSDNKETLREFFNWDQKAVEERIRDTAQREVTQAVNRKDYYSVANMKDDISKQIETTLKEEIRKRNIPIVLAKTSVNKNAEIADPKVLEAFNKRNQSVFSQQADVEEVKREAKVAEGKMAVAIRMMQAMGVRVATKKVKIHDGTKEYEVDIIDPERSDPGVTEILLQLEAFKTVQQIGEKGNISLTTFGDSINAIAKALISKK